MARGTNLYLGTDQGLLIYHQDGDESWHLVRHALLGRAVLRVSPIAGSSPRLAALVRGDGIFHSTDGGQEWLLTLPAAITTLIEHPQHPARLYVGLAARHVQVGTLQLGAVMASPDGGRVWRALAALPGGTPDTAVLALAVSQVADDPPVLWAGLNTGGVVASYDVGVTWQWRRIGLDLTLPITGLAAQHTRRPGLYAAGGGGVYYLNLKLAPSGPLGATVVWERCYPSPTATATLPGPLSAAQLCVTEPGGGRRARILAADGRGLLWVSDSSADTWTLLNTGVTGLPPQAFVTALAGHPSQPAHLFLGTAAGEVYQSVDGGARWTPLPMQTAGAILTLTLVRGA